jgi:hypothetical protein
MQRRGKYNNRTTSVGRGVFYVVRIYRLLGNGCVFYRPPRDHIRRSQTRLEAGSNTSTVTLRIVGGDEKGSLKSETVKYGRESQGTRTRERLRW